MMGSVGSTVMAEDVGSEQYQININNSIAAFGRIEIKMLEDATTLYDASNSDIQYPDYYAGVYVDNEGNLHIKTTDTNYIQSLDSIDGESTVTYEPALFSKNYLNEVQTAIELIMNEYEINHVSIMEDTNNVEIHIADIENETFVREHLLNNIVNFVDSSVVFKQSEIIYPTSINAGSPAQWEY